MVWRMIRSHADSIASSLPVITSMLDVVDSKQNLTVPQAAALFATALDFKPDVSSFTHTLSKVDLFLAKYCRKP